ncbi:hypothetical protein ABIA39_003972 [Nocardia sp. GAS34]|uniref:hypothetical protein n=1 Tax=unclassified Nocardia TaxID=2637762 RepID=UPI003D223BC9
MISSTKNGSRGTPEFADDGDGSIAGLREWAQRRLAHQNDPAITAAWSEQEVNDERELAERIRKNERHRRWKRVRSESDDEDRALRTQRAIDKADTADRLTARRALAVQRRMTSAHARLASLYRHRMWSLFTLSGVVAAAMTWSGTDVQHNIAPGGAGNPLYWFSYLVELMISTCLVVIMVGTNKVGEYGITVDRRMVAAAESALLALTVELNTYPYWHDGPTMAGVGVHAVPPVMIGVALMIHHAASIGYGQAIRIQAAELPDDDLTRTTARTTGGAHNPDADVHARCHDRPSSTRTRADLPAANASDSSTLNSQPRGVRGGDQRSSFRPRRIAGTVRPQPRLCSINSRSHPATAGSDAEQTRGTRRAPGRDAADASTPHTSRTGDTARTRDVGAGRRRRVDREQIIQTAEQHPSWSNKRIADEYGCSASAVDKIFRVTRRPGREPPPSVPQVQLPV